MKTTIQTVITRVILVAAFLCGGVAFATTSVGALPLFAQATPTDNAVDQAKDGVEAIGGGAGGTQDLTDTLGTVINVLLFIVGAVAVIMIIFSGIQYVASSGDPARIKKAKDTLIYSIVGLVVALLAFAVVNFVLTSLD